MVDNTHMIDPVLLNFLEHAGLKPTDLGEDGLKKAKEMADINGLYGLYEQNASEGKKKRDQQLKRSSMRLSRYSIRIRRPISRLVAKGR